MVLICSSVLTRWTWVWVNSGSWWWTGRPGVLRFMGLQRVWHDWATELNWLFYFWIYYLFFIHSSIDGYIGCSHILTIINNAAMITGVYMSFWVSYNWLFKSKAFVCKYTWKEIRVCYPQNKYFSLRFISVRIWAEENQQTQKEFSVPPLSAYKQKINFSVLEEKSDPFHWRLRDSTKMSLQKQTYQNGPRLL